jgi:hypothetical protein
MNKWWFSFLSKKKMVVQLFRNEEVQIQSASGLSNEERFSITNDQMAQLQAERILHIAEYPYYS